MNVDPRVAWAISEIQRRMGVGITVDALARSVKLSRSRFAHLFRQQIGVSPARYLRRFRLERARQLLEGTFLSVTDVMAAVGFSDPSHFSRDFRQAFGASPREWRKDAARRPPSRPMAMSRTYRDAIQRTDRGRT